MKALKIALTALMLVFGLALLGGAVPIARAGTLIVDNTIACDDVSGSPAYCTIQAAINAASNDDTISVNPGTYDEALTITKSLTLSGADKTNTIITYTGPAVEQLVFLGTNTGHDLDGPVIIENFTFFNGGGLHGDNDLLKFRARGVGGQITIRNNIFDGDGDGSISSPAKAIEEAMQASNFVITGNEFNNCLYGIWLNGGQNGAISNNIFSGSASGAIGMGGSDSGSLAPHNLTVTGNTMDNGKYGLVLARNIYDISFSCNRITNNSFAGILFWEYGPEDWSDVHFNYNNIAGNTSGMRGFSDPGATPSLTVDATNNWWGDASGPSGNGTGIGDSVLLNNVAFDPWLTEEIGDVCPPPTDDEGPITSNVLADPNPVAVNGEVTLTANVDDTNTGGSNIASAEYSLDGGITWYPMTAQDGDFDAVSENVTATFNAPAEAGIYTYNLCIRGTDSAGNTGPDECIELMLVVYDPEGGFVTGGGWIDSPPGAYMPGPSGIVVVTGDNVGVDWFTNDTRYDGYIAFVEGPASAAWRWGPPPARTRPSCSTTTTSTRR
jgi:parallel beta-helix repeat protein